MKTELWTTFSFDLPVRIFTFQKAEENNATELTSEARDIKVNQPGLFLLLK
jgi:hypothetical protein